MSVRALSVVPSPDWRWSDARRVNRGSLNIVNKCQKIALLFTVARLELCREFCDDVVGGGWRHFICVGCAHHITQSGVDARLRPQHKSWPRRPACFSSGPPALSCCHICGPLGPVDAYSTFSWGFLRRLLKKKIIGLQSMLGSSSYEVPCGDELQATISTRCLSAAWFGSVCVPGPWYNFCSRYVNGNGFLCAQRNSSFHWDTLGLIFTVFPLRSFCNCSMYVLMRLHHVLAAHARISENSFILSI